MRAMSETVVTLRCRVTPEGDLRLPRRLPMGPGEAEVTVRLLDTELERPREDLMTLLRRIWAENEAEGRVPRAREEIDAEIRAWREQDEERMLAIERLQDEASKARREREC